MNTLVKRNGFTPATSFFDDFLTRNLFDWSNWTDTGSTLPHVNIMETDDDIRVEMAAPGMKKEDFKVELDNDVLSIRAEISDETEENVDYTRREFRYRSFKRSFYLPNTVEADKIKARYKDGILSLVVPKKEEAKKKPAKTIAIT